MKQMTFLLFLLLLSQTATRNILVRSFNLSHKTTHKPEIRVIFKSPINESFKEAVRSGARIATEAFKPKVPITADVYFINETGKTLGSAKASSFQFINNHVMTVAMAKQFGAKVDTNKSDILLFMRHGHKWNVDPNRKTKKDEYFMPDTVVHELYHGLIFYGRGLGHKHNKTTGRHAVRLNGSPSYYFEHLAVETAQGDCSLLSYLDTPYLMGDAMTSNALWFRNAEKRIARIHAPSKYKHWSYLHIDPRQPHPHMKAKVMIGREYRGIGPYVAGIQRAMMQSEGRPRICNASDPRFFPLGPTRPASRTNSNLRWILPTLSACLGLLAIVIAYFCVCHRKRVSDKDDEYDAPC